MIRLVAISLFWALPGFAQTGGPSVPSKDEIFELLDKANQKITDFEDAIKAVKPSLDKADKHMSTNDLDAAATAHDLIRKIKANGPSAYGLVGLMATIDDLSLDAATASVQLLLQPHADPDQPTPSQLNQVMLLLAAKNSCRDISELIFHATMRYIHGEEEVLTTLLKPK